MHSQSLLYINSYFKDEHTPLYKTVLYPVSLLISATLVLPDVLAYLVMQAAVFYFYILYGELQERYYDSDQALSHIQVVMPLYSLVTAWGLLLFVNERIHFFMSVVGPFVIVLLTAMWPAFRLNSKRKQRLIRFEYVYFSSSLFFIAASLFWLWRSI